MEYMIFKESPFEVGGETDAFCASCKTDTQHTVVTVFEGEIRSVQCAVCGATHAYRPPRGDVDEEVPEPIAVRRRQSLRKRPWSEVMAEPSAASAAPYAPADTYREGQVIHHPSFGPGYVSELVSETKFEGTFADGPRILVHNRPDLAPVRAAARPEEGRSVRPGQTKGATSPAPAKRSARAPAVHANGARAKGSGTAASGAAKKPAGKGSAPKAGDQRAAAGAQAKVPARTRASAPASAPKKAPAGQKGKPAKQQLAAGTRRTAPGRQSAQPATKPGRRR